MWIDSYQKITWLDWGRFAAQGCKAGQSSRGVRCISQSLESSESSVHPADALCQSLGIRGNIGNQTPKVKGVGYGMVGLTWLTLIHPICYDMLISRKQVWSGVSSCPHSFRTPLMILSICSPFWRDPCVFYLPQQPSAAQVTCALAILFRRNLAGTAASKYLTSHRLTMQFYHWGLSRPDRKGLLCSLQKLPNKNMQKLPNVMHQ